MKKISVLILSLGISFSSIAQKKELKEAGKLIKKDKKEEAFNLLNKLENTVKGTEYESQYHFLRGKNFFGENSMVDYPEANKEFHEVLDIEAKNNEDEYSEDAIAYIRKINDSYSEKINAFLKEKNYKEAGDLYQILSDMNPERRDFLENLLACRINTEDFSTASVIIEKLLKNSDGKIYTAMNKGTFREDKFLDKESRDKAVKQKTHTDPSEKELDKEIVLNYYKNLFIIYNKQGNIEKQRSVLERAKKEFPKEMSFLESYANIIYQSGDKEDYLKALDDILALDPTKKDIWFSYGSTSQNLGKNDKAIMAYDKTIELDPKYRGAYINKGVAVLAGEKVLLNELNSNLKNQKKYDEIKEKLDSLYKKAIPAFQKAYDLKAEEGLKSTLIGLYKSLGETEKAEALK